MGICRFSTEQPSPIHPSIGAWGEAPLSNRTGETQNRRRSYGSGLGMAHAIPPGSAPLLILAPNPPSHLPATVSKLAAIHASTQSSGRGAKLHDAAAQAKSKTENAPTRRAKGVTRHPARLPLRFPISLKILLLHFSRGVGQSPTTLFFIESARILFYAPRKLQKIDYKTSN